MSKKESESSNMWGEKWYANTMVCEERSLQRLEIIKYSAEGTKGVRMKKVLLVLLVALVATSFVSADESDLYGASGENLSSFARIDDEDGSVTFYHFGSKEDGIYRLGLIEFQDDLGSHPHLRIEFKYFTHGNSIIIQPTTATNYDEEGNETGTKSGFDRIRGSYQIQTQDGETFLRLDDDLYLLIG